MTQTEISPTDGEPTSVEPRAAGSAVPTATLAADHTRSGIWWIALVVVLIAVRLFAVGYLLADGVDHDNSVLGGDTRRYEEIHDSPGTPYRDFDTEYPPVIVGVIYAVNGPTTWDTVIRLVATQLTLELATAGLLAWGWSKRAALAYLILGTPTIFFPFPWVRTDLVPVFLVVAAMVLAKRNKQVLAGALAATAVFAKFWPVTMAPLFVTRRQFRAFASWAITGALGTAAWVLWAGTTGIGQVFSFRGSKGWQIESLPGNIIFLLDPKSAHVEGGAWRTMLEVPGPVRFGLTVASFATVALAWWWVNQRHRQDDTATFGLAPLASVVALLVFASIISPQYVLWFLPFAAIVAVGSENRRFGLTIGGLTLAIVALSTFEFGLIVPMVVGHAIFPSALVLIRNVGLVVLLVLTLRALAQRRQITAATGAPSPGTAPAAAAPAATAPAATMPSSTTTT